MIKFIATAGLFAATMSTAHAQITPKADLHQHFFSPDIAPIIKLQPITAKDLIARLDSAGIKHALVLSVGYIWSSASRAPVANEYEHVKAENDWTAAQVAQYPDRLRAFCSVNPRRPFALTELERCHKHPGLHWGVKLHLGNSDVDLDNPANVVELRNFVAKANEYRMPIVVHMRTSGTLKRIYGAKQAKVFLDEVLPAAKDIPVQIAHMAGAGGYEPRVDSALVVFIDAIKKHDKRMKNVWFDVTTIVQPDDTPEIRALHARRIREVGVDRVLYGSDGTAGGNLAPREAWALFRQLPLTEREFKKIASNTPPYAKW